MDKDTREYLNVELEHFQKNAELQFNHFMQVFYFWTVIITAPLTAGILVNQDAIISNSVFPIFLLLIALLGWFLSAKMFDIRCSQLKYLSRVNYVREFLYKSVKDLPKSYKPAYSAATDLFKEARIDFGLWMAITMSGIDAVYFGFAIPLLQGKTIFNYYAFILYFLSGFGTYFFILWWRRPKS